MIQFIENKEIDKNKWNQCIHNSINRLVYAYDWYLDTVYENWAALVENDYESVMPLGFRKKLGVSYIFTPLFTQQLGVFSITLLDEKKCKRFIEAIPSKFKYLDYNFNSYNQLNKVQFTTKDNVNHLLDLINDYQTLSKNYSENLKRNLKKAEKSGVSIAAHIKPEEIIEIFAKNKGKELQNFSIKEYTLLKKLIYTGIHKGHIETYGAYTPHNELCAGVVFLTDTKRTIFLFSATNLVAKQLYAMPLLIDNYIKLNAGKDIVLDFEGSNDKNLARFYKSFGSKTVNYQRLIINKLPLYLNSILFLIKKIRKLA